MKKMSEWMGGIFTSKEAKVRRQKQSHICNTSLNQIGHNSVNSRTIGKGSLEKKVHYILIMKWLLETGTESGVMNIKPLSRFRYEKECWPSEDKNCQFTLCQSENK